jgi:hypothetical protein
MKLLESSKRYVNAPSASVMAVPVSDHVLPKSSSVRSSTLSFAGHPAPVMVTVEPGA